MIITLTPNPTIDRVYYLPALVAGTVHRALKEAASPSGKGIDASIILALLDEPTIALGFKAGRMGQVLEGYLDDLGVSYRFVEADGETRTVPVLVDQDKKVEYTITAPTLRATETQFEQLLALISQQVAGSWGLIAAGSLPPGVPKDGYAQVVQLARQAGVITLLDTSGDSLRHGIMGLPSILKINHMELADMDARFEQMAAGISRACGRPHNLTALATTLQSQIGTLASEAVIISMGTNGALAVTEAEAIYAAALQVPVKVTNGAGDAMDTGIMLSRQRGQSWSEALALGTAMAAAAVMHEATAGLNPQDVEELLPQVEVEWVG